MVNICLQHGNADGVFIGYLAFGPIFMGAILKRKQSGFDYGQLTLALVEKYKSRFYVFLYKGIIRRMEPKYVPIFLLSNKKSF